LKCLEKAQAQVFQDNLILLNLLVDVVFNEKMIYIYLNASFGHGRAEKKSKTPLDSNTLS
jgi:hypothetical protein